MIAFFQVMLWAAAVAVALFSVYVALNAVVDALKRWLRREVFWKQIERDCRENYGMKGEKNGH